MNKKASFTNKVILITGGTGSFGQAFTNYILKNFTPKAIRIFSRDELKQFEMANNLSQYKNKLRFFIGDVRDKDRLKRAAEGAGIIVHAAALKHVPICEYDPLEAVKTNVEGAINVIDAAIDNSIEKVIVMSTDKAVYPINLYGATKMVAEKLFIQANSYVGGERKTIFSCIRYGNVIASSGSVVSLFKEQRNKGEVTITDERMTRFWITLEQGVDFVTNCIEEMKGGEIFIPKIPSMKIVDLAEIIAPGVKKKIIGVRPGEKLHEILLTEEEAKHAKEVNGCFVIEPEFSFWNEDNFREGKLLPDGFKYRSDINDKWITEEQMRKILKDLNSSS